MDTSSNGYKGESLAARLLTEKGYRVICRNYRTRFGEIDIIAVNDKYLLFVEVKTRSGAYYSTPKEAVTVSKQRKILMAASQYMAENRWDLQPRFDVVEIYLKSKTAFDVLRLNHIENAFDIGGAGYGIF